VFHAEGRVITEPEDAGTLADDDPSAREPLDELVPLLYEELRAAARRQLRSRHRDDGTPTLATTALVNEAYLKLAEQTRATWRDRAHFLNVAAVAMRHILVDRARAHTTLKRGAGARPLTLDDEALSVDDQADLVLAIDSALHGLELFNARLTRVVELRFFAGLSEEETAVALKLNVRTVQRDWAKARALLRQTLETNASGVRR
jgi:RNA polymerase sigma factor (TIGR02999 family)